jgi:hypothetical protein
MCVDFGVSLSEHNNIRRSDIFPGVWVDPISTQWKQGQWYIFVLRSFERPHTPDISNLRHRIDWNDDTNWISWFYFIIAKGLLSSSLSEAKSCDTVCVQRIGLTCTAILSLRKGIGAGATPLTRNKPSLKFFLEILYRIIAIFGEFMFLQM